MIIDEWFLFFFSFCQGAVTVRESEQIIVLLARPLARAVHGARLG
jgi:hypothetical protein